LAYAFGLAGLFDHPEAVSRSPQAPVGSPRRAFPLPVVTVPIAIAATAALAFLFHPLPELSAECLEASRCCSARAHATVPVPLEAVQGCMQVLKEEPSRCAQIEQQQSAGTSGCRLDLLEASTSWSWTEAARAVPKGPRGVDPVTPKYPRVSCAEAMTRLRRARDVGQPGEWVVLRTGRLVIRATSEHDPDGVIYCEGFPLPIASTPTWSRELIVEPPGLHALLVQPLPAGRLAFRAICERCNAVLGERSRRR
jgi:hypothetical protein